MYVPVPVRLFIGLMVVLVFLGMFIGGITVWESLKSGENKLYHWGLKIGTPTLPTTSSILSNS
jgi:hypothetical protein